MVVRLAVLQVGEAGASPRSAHEQRLRTYELPANRGAILDRTGTPLAMTLEARDVYADPRFVVDPVGRGRARSRRSSGCDAPASARRSRTTGTFVYLDRQVDVDVADRLAELRAARHRVPRLGPALLPGRAVARAGPRVRGRPTASGSSGLEAQYDGLPGRHARGADRRGLGAGPGDRRRAASPSTSPCPATTSILTIDREIQFQAQRYLRDGGRENRAKGGTVVVMDPRTGDIYAMASYPWFDPNAVPRVPARDRGRTGRVTDAWEPGSVNKIDHGGGGAGDRARCRRPSGSACRPPAVIEGYTIHDAEPHPVETMTLGDIIAAVEQRREPRWSPTGSGNDALAAALRAVRVRHGRPASGSRARRPG